MPLKYKTAMLILSLFTLLNSSVGLADSQGKNLTQIQDKQFRDCVQASLSKEGVETLAALTKIKCHNDDIESVDGIAMLSSLESLSLFGNDIVEADLSMLKELTYINLAKNKLTYLNIQGLDKLETLYVFNNKLNTLNFQGVSSLTKMRMMQNQFTQLDISPLISLEQAYLWDNQLEDLQISGLDQLTFLDVKQNPMPDELYDFYDKQVGITISHDGNADDWN